MEEVPVIRTPSSASIGILTLDTRFPRILGDVGNAASYWFPVQLKTVRGASIDRVLKIGDASLLGPFIGAARELEDMGVKAIITSCGFLSIFQDELAMSVRVPVFTSSLLLIPMLQRTLGPDQTIGIITADSESLSHRHLRTVGVDPRYVSIEGLQNGSEFSRILNDELTFDRERVEAEAVEAARRLVEKDPAVGLIVLECTNLPPYARAIRNATGLAVFDMINLAGFVYGSVAMDEWPWTKERSHA